MKATDTLNCHRQPWIAAALSLFCTGLGHVYCGRIGKGVVLFFASLAFAPAAAVVALVEPSTAALIALVLVCLAVVGVYVYAVADSWLLARRLRNGYEPKDYNRAAVYAFFIVAGVTCPASFAMLVKAHCVQAFRCPASSMVPSILKGDRFLVSKLAYRAREPRRGELVVFRVPDGTGRTFLKRLIGLPGDTVAVLGSEVLVNGQKLPREAAPESALSRVARQATGEVFYETSADRRYTIMFGGRSGPAPDYPEAMVPDGTCFVLGDNRDNTRDSRHYGFVPLVDLLGRVEYIFWPAESWRRFGAWRE